MPRKHDILKIHERYIYTTRCRQPLTLGIYSVIVALSITYNFLHQENVFKNPTELVMERWKRKLNASKFGIIIILAV